MNYNLTFLTEIEAGSILSLSTFLSRSLLLLGLSLLLLLTPSISPVSHAPPAGLPTLVRLAPFLPSFSQQATSLPPASHPTSLAYSTSPDYAHHAKDSPRRRYTPRMGSNSGGGTLVDESQLSVNLGVSTVPDVLQYTRRQLTLSAA